MLRIVHLADLHLDVPFSSQGRRSAVSNARREALRQALKQALGVARGWQADALTIGGDLYEAEHVSPDTIQFLRQQFANAAPMRIIIAPGNHDPYTRNSPYAYVDWPANVNVFREARLTSIGLAPDMDLWGAAHETAAFTSNLVAPFRLPSSTPAVLLLHGTESSLDLDIHKRAFCPFSAAEVRAAGFGLALLGHIHRGSLEPARQPLLCYPGSPEPLGLDEETGHSILLAEWSGAAWKVEVRDISTWVCRKAQIDITEYSSRDQVIETIRGLWQAERAAKQCLARVELVGRAARGLGLDLAAIQSALSGDFEEIEIRDQTQPPFDIEALQRDATIIGAFVRRMLKESEAAARSGDEHRQVVVRRALTYGLQALENGEIAPP
jgi:DNA repair exonuclease SbcCD nuclease subunit